MTGCRRLVGRVVLVVVAALIVTVGPAVAPHTPGDRSGPLPEAAAALSCDTGRHTHVNRFTFTQDVYSAQLGHHPLKHRVGLVWVHCFNGGNPDTVRTDRFFCGWIWPDNFGVPLPSAFRRTTCAGKLWVTWPEDGLIDSSGLLVAEAKRDGRRNKFIDIPWTSRYLRMYRTPEVRFRITAVWDPGRDATRRGRFVLSRIN